MESVNQGVLREYQKATNQPDTTKCDYLKEYNQYLLERGTTKEAARPDFSLVPGNKGVIGSLEFPTVKIKESPIYQTKTNQSFFHYAYGSFPFVGKSGHLSIAVTDHWKNQVLLVQLNQLKVNDCFYLRMGGQTQVYQVVTLTKQGELDDRQMASKKRLVTIKLNNLSGFTTDQLVITSKQVNEKNVQLDTRTPTINYSYRAIVVTFLLINALIFSGLIFSYQRHVRKAHSVSFRMKNGGYRKLRRLLQITRGYYILLALITGFFLALMIYRYVYLR